MKILQSLLLITIFINNVQSQSTVTITCLKDAAIGYHDGANTSSNNYGSAVQNAAYCIPGAFGSGVNVNRALLDFDLSLIPTNVVIVSAKLNLYATGPIGTLSGHTGSNNACYLERVTQNWYENVVTWDNQPPSSSQNQVTLNQSSNSTQNYLNTDVTNLVKDMLNNPATSFGFKLRLISESVSNGLLFKSKENGNINYVPNLVITYTTSCVNTDTLIADYDASIGYHDGANTANNNYGTAQQNAAYTIPSAFTSGLNVNRALLHFDFSSIPSNAIILDAKLDLFAYGPVGSYPGHSGSANSSYIERVINNWSENTVTWNNQPATTTSNQVLLNGTTNPTLDYLNIDITQITQDIIQAGTNNGIILKLLAENPTNLLFFCSKDHVDSSKHPKLKISYSCNNVSVVESNRNKSDINIFPNPSKDIINFKINTSKATKGNLMIYDVQGKLVKTIELLVAGNFIDNITTIDIKQFNTGLYYYSIDLDSETKSGKFIVE